MAKKSHDKKNSKKPTTHSQRKSKSTLESMLNPVLEVIVEAHVSASGWSQETPNRLHALLATSFPRIEHRGLVGAVGAARAIEGGTMPPSAPAVQMWNQERTQLLQFGPGVIIANCLKYSRWDAFAPVLEAGVNAFLEVLTPARIDHLSFRMINHFDLGSAVNDDIELDKFFGLYAGLPKRFRDIEGLQISFQTTLKSKEKYASLDASGPIRLEVELRNASASDLTALSDGIQSASSCPSAFLLDIDTSCAFESGPKADRICQTAGQLNLAAMEALKSIVRPPLLKQYRWQET